jgi:hypothetical protein
MAAMSKKFRLLSFTLLSPQGRLDSGVRSIQSAKLDRQSAFFLLGLLKCIIWASIFEWMYRN